ncbi:MAG: DUF3817 domain-containing protein [Cyclobacteriaceae bacterium]|nr:DUF3817 domain-containing protein [Cyclobacteriaceae bacterium HetDA_MAG_MS6]
MLGAFKTQLGRFRLAAFAEGSTLLILVFSTLPLRLIFDITEISKVMGPIHGMLFMVYVFQAIQIKIEKALPLKSLLILLVAAFVPFGTFYVVPRMIRKHSDDN